MKIRHGFVSNSSSSSFVVGLDSYDTVVDLALNMVDAREWTKKDKELKAKLRSIKDKDNSIAFTTCNYDTFISREEDGYYVFTCNNHDFHKHVNMESSSEISWEKEEIIKSSKFYYWPEFGRRGLNPTYGELKRNGFNMSRTYCNRCIRDWAKDNDGNYFCISCGGTPEDECCKG